MPQHMLRVPRSKGGILPPTERLRDQLPMASSQSSRLDKTIKAAISPDQSRAARGLLDISQRDLAESAGGSLKAVKDFESGARTPLPATLPAMQDTLEKAGVELIPQNCGGQGVRWRYSEQTTTVSHETSRRTQASCTN